MPISGVIGLTNLGTVAASSLIGNPTGAPAPPVAIAVNPNNLTLTTGGTLGIGTGPIIAVSTVTPAIFNANTAFTAGPGGNIIHAIAADGVGANFTFDAYGAQPQMLGRRAQGTEALPTAVLTGTNLFSLAAMGYGATAYSAAARANVVLVTSENWTDAAQGTQVNINTTLNGGTITANAMQIKGGGTVAAVAGFQVGVAATAPFIAFSTIAPTGTFAVSTLIIRTNGSVGAGLYFANAGGSAAAVAGV